MVRMARPQPRTPTAGPAPSLTPGGAGRVLWGGAEEDSEGASGCLQVARWGGERAPPWLTWGGGSGTAGSMGCHWCASDKGGGRGRVLLGREQRGKGAGRRGQLWAGPRGGGAASAGHAGGRALARKDSHSHTQRGGGAAVPGWGQAGSRSAPAAGGRAGAGPPGFGAPGGWRWACPPSRGGPTSSRATAL